MDGGEEEENDKFPSACEREKSSIEIITYHVKRLAQQALYGWRGRRGSEKLVEDERGRKTWFIICRASRNIE